MEEGEREGGGGERKENERMMAGRKASKALHPAATAALVDSSGPSLASDGEMHACIYLHYQESIEKTSIPLSQRLIKSSHNDF